jgi:hypothetical protein
MPPSWMRADAQTLVPRAIGYTGFAAWVAAVVSYLKFNGIFVEPLMIIGAIFICSSEIVGAVNNVNLALRYMIEQPQGMRQLSSIDEKLDRLQCRYPPQRPSRLD